MRPCGAARSLAVGADLFPKTTRPITRPAPNGSPTPIPANVETLLKACRSGVAALKIFTDNKIDVEATSEGAIAYIDPGDGARKKKGVLNISKPAAVVAAAIAAY